MLRGAASRLRGVVTVPSPHGVHDLPQGHVFGQSQFAGRFIFRHHLRVAIWTLDALAAHAPPASFHAFRHAGQDQAALFGQTNAQAAAFTQCQYGQTRRIGAAGKNPDLGAGAVFFSFEPG